MKSSNDAYEYIDQLVADLALVRSRRDKLKVEHDELKIAHAKLQGEHAALVERTSTLTENIEKYRCDPYPAKIETLSGLATIPSEVTEPVASETSRVDMQAEIDRVGHTHDGDDPGDSSPHLDGGDAVAQAVAAG
jgi:chromosome segregation ATPase